jgi:chlorobactene glucosyltransferase
VNISLGDALTLFIAAALLTITGITISNALCFPRLGRQPRALSDAPPRVSVLIPARNESAIIGETLCALLKQDYPRLEVLLLDDNSTDGTAEIARALGDSRLRVLDGAALPAGWLGKNWACHQLSEAATGDLLIFTDADVRWEPGALRALIADMTRTQADLLTVWPTQRTVTPPERLVVSLMALAIIGYLPVIGTHRTPFAVFAAACGQCMAWRRDAYQRVGGHARVRDNVLEDVTMARLVKRAGLRLRMEDGAGLIGCRMYRDWPSVRDGYAKNILAGYGNSVPALLLATIFHWLIFVYPWAWLLLGGVIPLGAGWPLVPLALAALGVLIRMTTAAVTGQRIIDGLLMPVSVALMTAIAARSIFWHFRYGGPQWKGRAVQADARAGK